MHRVAALANIVPINVLKLWICVYAVQFKREVVFSFASKNVRDSFISSFKSESFYLQPLKVTKFTLQTLFKYISLLSLNFLLMKCFRSQRSMPPSRSIYWSGRYKYRNVSLEGRNSDFLHRFGTCFCEAVEILEC